MNTIEIATKKREVFVEISAQIQEMVSESEVQRGICIVFCPHTTAGLTINENADPDVRSDMINNLKKLVPNEDYFAHSEGNSDAHIKASLMGSSVTVPIHDGKLELGTWQGIYFCEFDGPRKRKCYVKLI